MTQPLTGVHLSHNTQQGASDEETRLSGTWKVEMLGITVVVSSSDGVVRCVEKTEKRLGKP
jgi:hypothetical protein